ncbi:PLP-dependent aminotransferase family protein [Ruficoccus sp. ZRK36]|uniref:aminotransferase-like domain-containing protein n=1 Tax=Ruficoccus sp. ZRK36 TaxID=2866311 RepID=UPI001C72A605|nr:PLP-dependent aminotransferase family protein [Ruficoccus sp. ZRK36]QYY36109.1 PLP-dependent aminotransferase family protein [Ruficoccus sp. ZRK36]
MKECSHSLSFSQLGRRATEPVITDLMHRALDNAELLSLAAGFTDNITLPVELVQCAVNRMGSELREPDYLQYGTNRGRAGLLIEVANWLNASRGEVASERFSPESVFISNGSQQALYLAMQSLCDAGDIVLVQQPTYFVFLELCRGLGIRPVSLPALPDGGTDFSRLPDFFLKLKREYGAERIKAFYLNSYFGNPSSRSVPVEEKRALGRALIDHAVSVPVIEDAAYRELWFSQPYPAPSIFSLPEFEHLPRLYLGTFTKPFATGLKVGYGVCSHPQWLERMLWLKGHQDFGTSNFNQAIIEDVMAAGEYPGHLERVRANYREKARLMGEALEGSTLRERGWSWQQPEGGLYYWLRAPEGMDLSMGSAFCEACLANGVLYVPGDLCVAEGEPKNFARLSFGALAREKLTEATGRFTAVAESGCRE